MRRAVRGLIAGEEIRATDEGTSNKKLSNWWSQSDDGDCGTGTRCTRTGVADSGGWRAAQTGGRRADLVVGLLKSSMRAGAEVVDCGFRCCRSRSPGGLEGSGFPKWS